MKRKPHGEAWRRNMRSAAMSHERMGNTEEAAMCHRKVIEDARLEAKSTSAEDCR